MSSAALGSTGPPRPYSLPLTIYPRPAVFACAPTICPTPSVPHQRFSIVRAAPQYFAARKVPLASYRVAHSPSHDMLKVGIKQFLHCRFIGKVLMMVMSFDPEAFRPYEDPRRFDRFVNFFQHNGGIRFGKMTKGPVPDDHIVSFAWK